MKKQYLYYIAAAAIIVIAVLSYVLFYTCNVFGCISLEWVKVRSAALKESAMENYFRSFVLYCLVYAGMISFGVPGVAPLTILGGYLFGIIGILYAMIGATLGCLGGFLIMRYILGRTIRRRYARQLERFQELVKKYGASYLLMIHYSSVVPFFFINTFAALANVPVITFIWTTILGSLPLLSIYSLAGRELGRITRIQDIFSPTVIILLVLLALLAIIPMWIKRSRHMRDVELR